MVSCQISDNNDERNQVITKVTTKSSEDAEADSSNDESEDEESLGKVMTKLGREIDRKSAGNIKRSKEEIAADGETENEFGYTESNFNSTVCKTSISTCFIILINL